MLYVQRQLRSSSIKHIPILKYNTINYMYQVSLWMILSEVTSVFLSASHAHKMFDITLRGVKDKVFDPLCTYIPGTFTPLHITGVAFIAGLLACFSAINENSSLSLILWFSNRFLDCLDGALARHRNVASDLGGFLDLLSDFVIYSLIPISVAIGQGSTPACWRAVAFLEATFHVNNFILFYIAAVSEKSADRDSRRSKELTSVMMRPALVEGMESAVIFTAMLAVPGYLLGISWLMAVAVSVGIVQRTRWVVAALK